jgi:four helix bundle protein
MNHSEVTMNNEPPNGNLIVIEKAIDAADEAISLVRRVPAPLKSLADQVIRSAASVPANLSEGHGRTGRDRIHHWRIAFSSAKEIDIHIRLLARSRSIDRHRAAKALQLFDEVRAMTWRLLHPTPRAR